MPLAVQNAVATALQQRQRCDSWNLHLDKFSFERGGDETAKTRALQKAASHYKTALEPHLRKAATRMAAWTRSLQQQHGNRFRRIALYNTSPLILHLGRSCVLENVGLYCDRTTGLPVIPGSGLKGVLSTWATWEANQKPDGSFPQPADWALRRTDLSANVLRIFGSDDKGGSTRAGDIIFVGGFPETPPGMTLDIVNPHRDDRGNDKAKLTPNTFLCLPAGTKWNFVFFARPDAEDAVALLDVTERWLRESLEQVGLGAKTAAGYGRFGPQAVTAAPGGRPQSAEEIAQRDQAVQAMRSDYPNDATFKALVIDKLDPGQLAQLEKEIPKLRKPENAAYLQVLMSKLATRDFKDLRKKLREKPWFPQEWLPS